MIQNENYGWVLVVDVRSAINLPLNARTDHGLPSTRVQVSWSKSVQYEIGE
jgi:hypothetical protein